MSKISRNIKKLRASSDMTQEELAVKIHVTRQTVSSWETDRTQPDLQMLLSIAEVFSIEPEELIYGKKRNTAEEKEKQFFGNTLVTVLSILGCLLIGVGVVMIFIKWWQEFPDLLKLLTCFVPAILGQAFGIYTYIKKKASQAWCEGASVLWMLGVGVTTSILVNLTSDYTFVDYSLVFIFLAAGYFILMLVFGSLSPLPVVQILNIMWFVNALETTTGVFCYLNLESGVAELLQYILIVAIEAAFTGIIIYSSKKLYPKAQNILRYTFAQWINLASMVVFVFFAFERLSLSECFVSLLVLASIVFFAFGHKEKDVASPYRVLGLPGSAIAMCFFSIMMDFDVYSEKWACISVLLLGLLPFILYLYGSTKPESVYLRAYGVLATTGLLVFNILTVIEAFVNSDYNMGEHIYADTHEFIGNVLLSTNFPICFAALIMLVIHGARERKLLYLNLGFILSCVSVIVKLYLLELGFIATGVVLIACGAALLFVNLKFSRLREKEKLASLTEGEEEEQ